MTYKVLNKFRFAAFVIIALILITVIGNVLLSSNTANAAVETKYQNYYVSSGETLWNIAKQYAPADMNIYKYIDTVCQINGINASTLYAGTTIKLPVY